MTLKKTYCKCGGESREKIIPWSIKNRLNNQKLTRFMAQAFIGHLLIKKKIKDPIKVVFSNKVVYSPGKKKKIYWGLTYNWCRTIYLYRHSVWIFLHEIAHILAPKKEEHGEIFSKKLQLVYKWWNEFKEE